MNGQTRRRMDNQPDGQIDDKNILANRQYTDKIKDRQHHMDRQTYEHTRDIDRIIGQGTLTEGKSSLHLTSSLR
jgi:hypothetical protein